MSREETLGQIEQAFGAVPRYLAEAPDAVLEQFWTQVTWLQSDSRLSMREKALVGFGAAAAIHCEY